MKGSDTYNIEQYNSGIKWNNEPVSYVVRNIPEKRREDCLRLIITASYNDLTYTDRIDLFLSKCRKSFENASSKLFNIQPAFIEDDLLKLITIVEEEYKRRTLEKAKTCTTTFKLSTQEKEKALNFLKHPSLTSEIVRDITGLGYVGDDDNKLLVYLVASSRKLSSPLSVLIRSQSSTGKSYLMDTICSLMPDEDINKWSALTSKALFYMPNDGLKHKLIVIDERKGVEEAEYPIRSLQSGGKLTLAVPLRNKNTGDTETVNISKDGPIAYMDASTDNSIHPENANRCFEAFLDETEIQTEMIHEQQRLSKTLEGWKQAQKREKIYSLHKNAQRLLKPIKVIIPYIKHITFPTNWLRCRRDFIRFVTLIEVVTYLHQYQREVKKYNGEEYIESTIKDYELAYSLAKSILFNTFQELDKPTFDFYGKLQAMVRVNASREKVSPEKYWFTRAEIRQHLHLPDYIIKRYMKELKDLEYFNVKGRCVNGARDYYSLAKGLNGEKLIKGLTTPEELKTKTRVKRK